MDRLGDWVVMYFRNIANLEEILCDTKTLACSAVVDAAVICSRLHLAAGIQRLNYSSLSGQSMPLPCTTAPMLTTSSAPAAGGPVSGSGAAATTAPAAPPTYHLRSRNVHSEFVLMLSPTKNVAEALRLFSCSEDCTAAVFALHSPQREDMAHIVSLVKGDLTPLSDLTKHTDVARVMKLYHIPPAEVAFSRGSVEPCVVSRIATCDI